MPPDFDPPFCPGGMLMGTTDRTIDTVLLPVNPTFGIGLLLEGFEHPLPHASFDPSIEAAGHRAPWPIPLWQVSPRRPGSHNPQDGIEDQTMILCWTTHFWLLRWQQGSQLLPLLIRQFSSSHTPFYRLETICKQALAQHAFLQDLLDALPSSVSVVQGDDARLVLTNRAATGIWGAEWSPDQPMQAFLQQHTIRIEDTQGRPFPPETWATTRALLKGETVLQHQETIRQPSGARLPVLVNAVPLSSSRLTVSRKLRPITSCNSPAHKARWKPRLIPSALNRYWLTYSPMPSNIARKGALSRSRSTYTRKIRKWKYVSRIMVLVFPFISKRESLGVLCARAMLRRRASVVPVWDSICAARW